MRPRILSRKAFDTRWTAPLRMFLVVASILSLIIATPAAAQYMFLDSNGDGQNTAADILNPNGMPTSVDVWIKTDTNRDDSPAVCSTNDGALTINSYVSNLQAINGTVTYGTVTDQMGFGVLIQPQLNDSTYLTFGRGATPLSPGTYKLMTVDVTGSSGEPKLIIIPETPLAPANTTSFGSMCSGLDADNTLKVCETQSGNSDWCDTDGLGDVRPPAAVTDLGAS